MMQGIKDIVIHLIWNSVDFFILHHFMKRVYGSCVRMKKGYLAMTVLVIAGIAAASYPSGGFYNVVDMILCSYLFLFFYRKNLFRQTLFSACLLVITFAWAYSLAEFMSLHQTGLLNSPFGLTFVSHAGIWIFLLLVILFTGMQPEDTIPGTLWAVLFTIPVISIGVIMVSVTIDTYYYDSTGELARLSRILSLLSTLFILFMNLLVFYIYDRVARYQQKNSENLLLNRQISIQTKHYHELDSMHQRVRSMKHDMKNQLGMLSYLLEKGKTEEAKIFLADLGGHVEQIGSLIVSGNETIDSILNMKFEELRHAGIPVTADIAIPPGITLTYEQTVVIFGNLFDNAKEASLMLPEYEREVRFHLKYIGYVLYLTLTNRCLPSAAGPGLQTAKPDKLMHGIGLKNIRKYIEDVGGSMEISQEDGWFTVRIVLYEVSGRNRNQR